MKITLPEHIGDITLEQYQKYHKLCLREDLNLFNFNTRKIEIFTGLSHRQVKDISHKDYSEIVEQIDKAMNEDTPFKNTFKMNGIEYGFVPNLDKITTREFVDLSTFGVEIEDLHKTMGVLFRKVTKKDAFGNYNIEYYSGTEEKAEAMKQMPMNIVNGALLFFCNLARELRVSIQRYTEAEQAKAMAH
jgi:hypothetical protein